MRTLLAAVTCEKGDVAGNLAMHLDVIVSARRQRCDVAVFPEFSLTGSMTPGNGVELDDDAVRALVDATTGVTAVFGLSERTADATHITQVAARDGEIVAVLRKRHLGEDEDGFTVGTATPVFDVAGRRCGIVICAESKVDFTWDADAAAGAEVVFMCSAPGLYERRTTEEEWQDGYDWWCSDGVAAAQRQAKRLGLWVGLATQAGSTVDEDFPGIAALISPDGEIVQRLPDRRPGLLTVDL